MEIKNYFAQDAQGNIMPSANCYLYLPGTTTLAIGLVDGNGVPISNPFLASGMGQITFGAPNGVYDLRVALGARDWTIKVQCADIVQAMDVMDSILGSHAENPTARNNGQPLEPGDETWNSTDKQPYWWNGSAWVALNSSAQQLEARIRDSVNPENGAVIVGRGVVTIDNVFELLSVPERSDISVNVTSYYPGWITTVVGAFGGGRFIYDGSKPKSKHNGGTVISSTVPWDGMQTTHRNFLDGVGETDISGYGCWVRTDEELNVWSFGAVKFINDGVSTTTDSTYAFQKAIYAAKKSPLTLTHSISDLRTVFCDGGGARIDGQLIFPEGVVLDGKDKLSSRLCFSWGVTTKIISYGRIYDQLEGNPVGTTFTKNWGLKNLSLFPYYPESGPSSCTYFDYLYDIEPVLHSVRIVMHKGAISGGQLNATAAHFKKTIDPDFIDVTFDGGLNHLDASDSSYGWGMRTARMSGLYSYNAKSHALHTGNGSNNNTVRFDTIQMPEQVGDNRGIFIEGDGKENNVDFRASGTKLKYGAIIEGTENTVTGISGGSVLGVDVRGSGNTAKVQLTGATGWSDTGENSTLELPGLTKSNGISSGTKSAIPIPAVATWVDVAEITFSPGTGRGANLTASVSAQVEGVGRDCYDSRWLVGQTTTGITSAVEFTPGIFNPAGVLKLRVVSSSANIAKLQVQIESASIAGTVDVSYTLISDKHIRIKTI